MALNLRTSVFFVIIETPSGEDNAIRKRGRHVLIHCFIRELANAVYVSDLREGQGAVLMVILQTKVELKRGRYKVTLYGQRRGKKVVAKTNDFAPSEQAEMFAWIEKELEPAPALV